MGGLGGLNEGLQEGFGERLGDEEALASDGDIQGVGLVEGRAMDDGDVDASEDISDCGLTETLGPASFEGLSDEVKGLLYMPLRARLKQ